MPKLLIRIAILVPHISFAKENIIVFHAGNLSVHFSKMNARKITELIKPADIVDVADYSIIDNLLIPEYTKFNVHFAANEMVIAYTAKSQYSDIINSNNWYNILLKKM